MCASLDRGCALAKIAHYAAAKNVPLLSVPKANVVSADEEASDEEDPPWIEELHKDWRGYIGEELTIIMAGQPPIVLTPATVSVRVPSGAGCVCVKSRVVKRRKFPEIASP
jgi:hypothetical protein